MTTYTVGLSVDKKRVHVANAGVLPAGYTNIGTFDHNESDDPLGAYPDSHVLVHHVQDVLYKTSFETPALDAMFPYNITDLAAVAIFKGWESFPVRVTSPAITGTARVGFTLTCSAGSWTGPTTTLARRWFAAGIVIPAATGATYVPVVGDLGKVITCEVTPSNAFGNGAVFVTAATAAVIAA